MSITLKEDKSIRVENYSLRDFIFDVAKAAKGGYSPVDTNDKYVQGFSSWFTCGMVHDDELTNEQRIAIGLSAKVENTNTNTKAEDKVAETAHTASVEQDQPKQTTPTVSKTTRSTKKSV